MDICCLEPAKPKPRGIWQGSSALQIVGWNAPPILPELASQLLDDGFNHVRIASLLREYI